MTWAITDAASVSVRNVPDAVVGPYQTGCRVWWHIAAKIFSFEVAVEGKFEVCTSQSLLANVTCLPDAYPDILSRVQL